MDQGRSRMEKTEETEELENFSTWASCDEALLAMGN